MPPETPNTEKENAIYQTILNRNRAGESGKGFLNEAILRALKRSYISFSKRFPELADYVFDSLGNKAIASEIIKFFQSDKEPNPNTITRTWVELLPVTAYEQSSSYLLEAATTFIESIYFDFLKEPILKTQLLNKYDASSEHLSDNLGGSPEFKNTIPIPPAREKTKPPAASEPVAAETAPPEQDGPGITQIILGASAPEDLTPKFLAESITPYLTAIANVQLVINEILQRPTGKVVVKSIRQDSSIIIRLEGAAEAIQLIMEVMVPWRQEQARFIAQLTEQETQAEIEGKKANILEKRSRDEKATVEAKKQRADAEKLKLESEKRRDELNGEILKLGLKMLNRYGSNIDKDNKIALLTKLAPHIELICLNDLDISIQK